MICTALHVERQTHFLFSPYVLPIVGVKVAVF